MRIVTQSQAQITCQMRLLGPTPSNIDSLENLVILNKESVSYLKLLLIIEDSRFRYSPQKFGHSLPKIKELAEKFNNKEALALYYFYIGRNEQYLKKSTKDALGPFLKALSYFSLNKDTVGLVRTHLELAAVNQTPFRKTTGNLEECFVHAQQAILLANKYKNIELKIIANRALSLYYFSTISRPGHDRKYEALQLESIRLSKLDKRLSSYEAAGAVNLSAIYLETNKPLKALNLLKSVSQGLIDNNPPNVTRIYYINLGQANYYLKNYEEAKKALVKALNISPNTQLLSERETIYSVLKSTYTKEKKFKQALMYADSSTMLRDSIFKVENSKQINELQTQYQTKEKDHRNQLLSFQNEKIKKTTRFYLYLLFGFLFVLISVGSLLFTLYRLNNRLKILIKGREKLLTIIAHDMRKPLISFQNMATLISRLLRQQAYNDIQTVSTSIDNTGHQIQTMLDNLLKWAISQHEPMPYRPQLMNLATALGQVIDLFQQLVQFETITITLRCSKSLTVWADPNGLNLIIRNLIDNSLKHIPMNGFIEINCTKASGEFVDIQVIDNGSGIENKQLLLLQDVLSGRVTGHTGQNGLGLGILLVREFTVLNKGTITVESSEKKGTSFVVSLPVNQEKSLSTNRYATQKMISTFRKVFSLTPN